MGTHIFPFPPDSPQHDEGAPVRVLFRPEAVEISEKEFAPEEVKFSLGVGALQERNFGGPLDRLRFEVRSLQGSRPVKPALQYGQRYPVIDVIGKSVATAGCKPGQVFNLGVKQYHVLHPSGIRMLVFFDPADSENVSSRIADVMISASHGPATFVSVVPEGGPRDAISQKIKGVIAGMKEADHTQLDVRVRSGQLTRELVREVQGHFYDFVIFGGNSFSQDEVPIYEPVIRRLLVYLRIPVMIGAQPPEGFRKILICTAAGEPGKGDVRLGARIARHAGSVSTIFHALTEDAREEWRASVTKHLEQAQALLEAHGVSSEVQLLRGPWQRALHTTANAGGHDLIVLGTSGSVNYGVADFGLELVRRTKKCVLLVPPGEGVG